MSITASKLVGERITLDFWYTDELADSEAITAHEIQVQIYYGLDPDPLHIVHGAGDHDDLPGCVTHQFKLGIPGCIYQIACIADTSAGRRLARQRRLAILPSPSLSPPLFGTLYTTHLYPIEVLETIENDVAQLTGKLRPMPFPLEAISHAMVQLSGTLNGTLIFYSAEPEEIDHAIDQIVGTLEVKLITLELPPEEIEHAILNLTGTLQVKLVQHTQPTESINHAVGMLTGTLT